MTTERRDWDERSTVLARTFDPSPPPEGSFTLVVVEGPDAGQRFVVDATQPTRVLVGKSPVCALRLTDPQVSRRHAAIDLAARRLRLTDMNSTNGTFVDGVALLDGFLSGGELVRMGGTAIRVERDDVGSSVELPPIQTFGKFVGGSTEIRRLYALCERIAQSNVPVVIEGETGTGKEVLAEALHDAGPRASCPYVVFDCTAVPPNLVESELFGHEKGAFTGAVSTRKGVFEQAHGGTLLIDEIGDLELSLQPKLLRAIERSEVRRVGGDRSIRVDVRVMAATRRDLDQEVQAGRFRDDLYHRLAVTRIELPPLRERRGDIHLLATNFWKDMGGEPAALTPELLRRWEDYAWPGNVRELRNAVARQLALGALADLDDRLKDPETRSVAGDFIDGVLKLELPLAPSRQHVIDEFERRYVGRLLEKHGGNVARAAEAAGVARRYFQLLKTRKSGTDGGV